MRGSNPAEYAAFTLAHAAPAPGTKLWTCQIQAGIFEEKRKMLLDLDFAPEIAENAAVLEAARTA